MVNLEKDNDYKIPEGQQKDRGQGFSEENGQAVLAIDDQAEGSLPECGMTSENNREKYDRPTPKDF